MSDPKPDTTPTPSSASQPAQSAPPSPPVDTEALIAQVKQEALKAVEARDEARNKETAETMANFEANLRNNLANQISGKKPEEEIDPLLKQLLTNTGGTINATTDIAVERAVKQIKDEKDAETKQAQDDGATVAPFTKDYPSLLTEHEDVVSAFVMTKLAAGKDRQEAIKEACEDTIKKLKLKSISERKKDGTYAATALPGVSGQKFGGEESFDPVDSSKQYFAGLKANSNRLKNRASKTAT
jgi:hypothetical protein